MFVERRKVASGTKYYLVHSYRDAIGKVRKLRVYLGKDLTETELGRLRSSAEEELRDKVREYELELFGYSLSVKEQETLNTLSRIDVVHLNVEEWGRFAQDFVYNTNAIEGSALDEEEVARAIEDNQGSGDDEHEARGVARAIEYIRTTKRPLTLKLILELHRLCFEHTKSFAGRLRDVDVVIRDRTGRVVHRGIPLESLDDMLEDLVKWYAQNKTLLQPLLLAAIVHNQFEYIHPFRDGNGRVGRLLLNYILLRHGYPPITIYFDDRAEYYATLKAYSTTHDLVPTMRFLIKQYRKTLDRVTTTSSKP